MNFQFTHCNINVTDLDKSIAFYEEALDLHVITRNEAVDGSFTLCYLSDGKNAFQLELTWLRDHPQAYELGENESHIAFVCDNFQEAHAHHKAMDCICFENEEMGIYFIHDPDDYWIEILPAS